MIRRPRGLRRPSRAPALLLLTGLLVMSSMAASGPAAAQPNACNREAADIRRAERQLPRLEVAPPADQQIVCITLETNILFARRLAAHLKHCPRSPLARRADAWKQNESKFLASFSSRRCKPAIRNYRG